MVKNINYILCSEPEYFVEYENIKKNNFSLYRYETTKNSNGNISVFNKIFNPLFNEIQSIDIEKINNIWETIDENSYIIKDSFTLKKHYQKNIIDLSNIDLFYLELIVSYLKSPDFCNFLIPVTYKLLEDSNPIDIYNLIEKLLTYSIKNVYFITDSIEWVNIYTQNPIQKNENTWEKSDIFPEDFFWVEGDFDKFTFDLFIPDSRFLIGGSCSKIFSILNKNPDHKAIIDRDGYSSKTMAFFRERYNISCTSTVECENLWLKEEMYLRISTFINSKNFNFGSFKENVINRAKYNFENIFNRLENRQKYLEYHLIPYLNIEELERLRNRFKSNIINNDYETILDWFDNKSLFDFYIKELGFRNIIDFKREMNKNKNAFNDISIEQLIK